jgi:hypothetical protein
LQSSDGDPTAGFLCCGGVILFVVIIGIAANSDAKKRAQALEQTKQAQAQAKDAYQNSLVELKANPTSADLRQKTLERGRAYSNLTRNKGGVTIFDEVALMNDIEAACAGAAISENRAGAQKQTIEGRLEKLADLKVKGLIDEQEYAARKQKILDEV